MAAMSGREQATIAGRVRGAPTKVKALPRTHLGRSPGAGWWSAGLAELRGPPFCRAATKSSEPGTSSWSSRHGLTMVATNASKRASLMARGTMNCSANLMALFLVLLGCHQPSSSVELPSVPGVHQSEAAYETADHVAQKGKSQAAAEKHEYPDAAAPRGGERIYAIRQCQDGTLVILGRPCRDGSVPQQMQPAPNVIDAEW